MRSSFHEALLEFSQFLEKNGYAKKVAWVSMRDVLLSGSQLIYVRVRSPGSNEIEIRQLFEACTSEQRGILFGTICEIGNTTYAYAWSPHDASEAERSLMHKGLKMSAKVGASKVPGEAVRSRLRWYYLRFKLREMQREKNQLFC